jgi:small multidrug resistance pump
MAVACFMSGASLSRVYVATGRLPVLILGLAIYTLGNIIMVRLMRETGLGPAMSLSTISQLIVINAIAVVVFGERPAAVQVVGIGFGLLAVALILLPTLNR